MTVGRKNEHIKLAVESSSNCDAFKDIHIVYDSIPEIDFNEIDTYSIIFGKNIKFPIIINAITGGSERGREINAALSRAASIFGIPIASGSQTIAVRDKSLEDTFAVIRKFNRDGFILANVSANESIDTAKRAVEMIDADALQLHLNVLQELIMAEGDRNFTGVVENILQIKENVGVPVVVKEVGFGMSRDSAVKLMNIGIGTVDIGGFGGTNFARIESLRRNDEVCSDFCTIGIPTPVSLHEVCGLKPGIEVICGGGIRNGLDIVKAMIMGADAISLAYPLLKAFEDEGENGIVKELEKLIYEFKVSMTAAGAPNVEALHHKRIVTTGDTLEWINQLKAGYQE